MSILCEIFDGFCEIWIIIDFFNKIGERGRFLFGPYVRHFSSKYVFRWRWYFHCNFIFLETGIGKDVIFQKLTDFGSNYGTIEFPPMLTPIPAKPTLFDIAGDKGLGFHIFDHFWRIFFDQFWNLVSSRFSIAGGQGGKEANGSEGHHGKNWWLARLGSKIDYFIFTRLFHVLTVVNLNLSSSCRIKNCPKSSVSKMIESPNVSKDFWIFFSIPLAIELLRQCP